ncbi:metallophosphoesterase family protein [Archangium gephyra]|uniref:metallophosphoesterase family protein n=1 Tax=Archangium gephyra TaxID=48 RepID=UPI003B7F334D
MSIGERHLFSWLHLSDLHFGHGDITYGWDQKTVLSLLKSDVEKARAEWPELPPPQAILVTGDIAFSGGKCDPAEYHDADVFLRELTTLLGLKPEDVYLVPGNHDVQRDVAKELVEQVRKDPGALNTILRSEEQRKALYTRQANYQQFADGFAKRNLDAWSSHVEIPGFGTIELVGLNTAMVSNDNQDQGNLVLSGEQRHLLSTVKGSVRLLLTHHPFEAGWLRDDERLRAMAQKGTTVHLCGHMHDPRVDLVSQAGGQNHVRVVAAAAHRDPKEAGSSKDSHGYNFASLMIDARGNLQLRTWPRRWFPHWDGFRVDHLGVPDRRFHDDKALGSGRVGSGLVLDGPDKIHIAGAHFWGSPSIRWGELLHGKHSLEIFGIAARDLFEQPNSTEVKALLDRGGKVHVVLADPRNKTAMARYDEDFCAPLGHRTKKVVGALKQIMQLRSQLDEPSRLSVGFSRYGFKYSAYRIDGDVLFVPYGMSPGKNTSNIPALLFDARSSVVKRFLEPDLNALRDGATPVTEEVYQEALSSAE